MYFIFQKTQLLNLCFYNFLADEQLDFAQESLKLQKEHIQELKRQTKALEIIADTLADLKEGYFVSYNIIIQDEFSN